MKIFPSRSRASYALPWRAKGNDDRRVKEVDVKVFAKPGILGKSFHDAVCTAIKLCCSMDFFLSEFVVKIS